jgi:hypothetical protein
MKGVCNNEWNGTGVSALISRMMEKARELRRHQRVRVPVLGRYMLADQQEHPCQTLDMSPGGLALVAPVQGQIGERVVCYLDHFGRLEGKITRCFDGGFAIELLAPPSKREKLADQLTWHANRSALGVPEGRDHNRIVPRRTEAMLRVGDGRVTPVRLVDLSISGAAFEGAPPLEIGTSVTLGRRGGRVARVVGPMTAIEFLRLIPREEFDESIEL